VGAAYGVKQNYDPGPLSATRLYGEPIQGYESHAAFEQECQHCHAPVRCLSANLCQDCHRQIAQERASASGLHGLLPGTDKCQNCHAEHQGRDAVISKVPFANVNHERLTGFDLDHHQTGYDGASLTCQDCHREGRLAAETVACSDCHEDHDPAFVQEHVARLGDNCTGCHDGRDRMVDLDHEVAFALTGAHQETTCQDCHADLAFDQLARTCAGCHQGPEVHDEQFGDDCARCHTAIAWVPAELRQHIFPLDHGAEDAAPCETCHAETYVTYDCYGCHDHQPAPLQATHSQEGIAELEPCADCHPTGIPGEAEQAAGQGATRERGIGP